LVEFLGCNFDDDVPVRRVRDGRAAVERFQNLAVIDAVRLQSGVLDLVHHFSFENVRVEAVAIKEAATQNEAAILTLANAVGTGDVLFQDL
jgi:hypothetical protein